MSARWEQWVAFWSETEHPRSLALLRILLGVVLLADLLTIVQLDLVVPLFGVDAIGGLSGVDAQGAAPWIYRLLPHTVLGAHLFHGAMVVSALGLTLGLFTRTSAVAFLLLSAQWHHVLPGADRGIDILCRDVLLFLAFSGTGRFWSLDALWSTGRLAPNVRIGAWARRLVMGQLVLMYFVAGLLKNGEGWFPWGDGAALFRILQDPAIARFDFAWLADQPWFFLTQVGSWGTLIFQYSYPIVLLWLWYRATPDRPGRLRALSNRLHLEWWWIGTGAVFHLLLAATCELGIFPWAMLALYPAWVAPDQWPGVQRADASA